ncbi:MAG TPA: preprotein translocase subunit SecY [Anaerolineae bacterium]|nr:preprotein translocase subunit SecY [Anaerolineae bacterium]
MLQVFKNAFTLPDLRKRIIFTLGILVLYQLAAHVPVPGVNQAALQNLLQGQGATSALANILNLLSGGALSSFSVLAMGVYPYITAQIIIQLLAGVIPSLERMLREEGTAGRQKLETYTFLFAIPMALLSAIGQIRIFSSGGGGEIIPGFGSQFLPTVAVLATMTAGTFFAIWLGQLITEQGIGQGISIIIFGGIVARIPQNIAQMLADPSTAFVAMITFAIVIVLTVAVIVFVQEGERRIPVQYGKRVRGRRVFGGGSTFIPLKVNMSGMIPLIFAQSLLVLPAIIFQIFAGSPNPDVAAFFNNLAQAFSGGRHSLSWIYWLMMFLLVVGFTFFYTDVLMQQQNMADTLQKQGGFIPGIRPGQRTSDYIMAVSRRITLVGALFLGGIAVLPFFLTILNLIPNAMNMSILSTGMLIVVGVVLDTIRQLEAQLTMRHYEGFLK